MRASAHACTLFLPWRRFKPSAPFITSPPHTVAAALFFLSADPASIRSALATHNSYAFGECYYEVTKDQAEELLDSQKDKVAEEMGVVEEELRSVTATLADLKAALYGRFGKNINLEE